MRTFSPRVITLLISAQLLSNPAFAQSGLSSLRLGAEHFALERELAPRVDLDLGWRSDDHLADEAVVRELRLYSFFESGASGDRSFDLDRLLVRFSGSKQGHFWFGRGHPLEEGKFQKRVSSTSAIGANWTQNQSNPLRPRVSGWLGAGWSSRIDEWELTAAMSPVFLPSFGPRLDLSEMDGASGSRFAKLPPQYVNSQRELVAIRYKVDAGSLSSIVLQHQSLIALARETQYGHFRLVGWSAPSPNPGVDISDMIRLSDNDANALVTAVPKFPRENFLALQWKAPKDTMGVFLETAREMKTGRMDASLHLQPLDFLVAGAMHRFETPAPAGSNSGLSESAPYSRNFWWFEAGGFFLQERLHPTFRMERHLGAVEDAWVNPRIEWQAGRGLSAQASLNLLVGQKGSYFGNWRSLDSFETGVRYVW